MSSNHELGRDPSADDDVTIDGVQKLCADSATPAQKLLDACIQLVAAEASLGKSKAQNTGLQSVLHGCAWMGAYVQALVQLRKWAHRLSAAGRLGRLEALILQAGHSEYLAQIRGGLPMSQCEWFRPDVLLSFKGHADEKAMLVEALGSFDDCQAVRTLVQSGFAPEVRSEIAALLAAGLATRQFGDVGFEDDTLSTIRETYSKFSDCYADRAHQWHLNDELIPDEVVRELANLGTFALTVSPDFGGLGMGKMAMCVVTEELSRGFLGLGSLGTRAEIAAELIGRHGTESQRTFWLPGIADGTILPAAAFTEPDAGSDLASIRTRAIKSESGYVVFGNKTWTTHGARSDMLTLLARTGEADSRHAGVSIFLAAKPRGSDVEPFPAAGLEGSEIRVLGYRGMKEYEIAFDGFRLDRESLLGESEGDGFRQLMVTFESARIQTAARAVGVAQAALEHSLSYSQSRVQFGKAIAEFPRVSDKIAWMGVETMLARQLCYFAARHKDAGLRCDVEAGMAKLLAARVAWSNADNGVQIHGGNGYAEEFPISRILCDARILSVFEGAAEIQAEVISRALIVNSRNQGSL